MTAPVPADRSAGFVLVNALIIVAAMAAAATFLLSRAEGGRMRLVAMQEADVLTHALDAFETLGRVILDRDLRNGAIDGLNDSWAQAILDVPLARGRVSGKITDQQALFNLNWLANPDDALAHAGWPVLLRRIGISPQKGDAIVDYLAPQGPSNRAAFRTLSPSISPLGGGILLIDQLAALTELQPEDIRLLRRHTSALPTNSRININSADLSVLVAMLPQLSIARLDGVLQHRQKDPYTSVDAFFQQLGLSPDPEDPDAVKPARFAVGSNWFGADISATLDARSATRRVLLRRQDAPIGTQIEWRVSEFR